MASNLSFRTTTITTASLAALLLAFGMGSCGGTAVVDDPIDGTSTGSNTGSGTSTGTSTGTGTPTSTTTTPMTNLCPQACSMIEDCYDAGGCTERCNQTACASQHNGWLACYIEAGANSVCGYAPGCKTKLNSWLSCESPGLVNSSSTCWGSSDGSCGCGADDGATYFETECYTGSGTSTCLCKVNGKDMGKCTFPGPATEACGVLDGCCAGVFFVPY